jgi:hypothetical protein
VIAPNTLGEYLRARRELVDPGDVGLHVAGVRRTPGLRREEVAALAGISADYCLRLEQGRDRNPAPGENRLRSMFLDPAEPDLYPDWPKAIGGLWASCPSPAP